MGIRIQALIAAGVVFIVSLFLFQPLAAGADQLYREFVGHCSINGTTTVKLHTNTGDIVPVTQKSGGKCTATTSVSSALTEDDTSVAVASNEITGGKWITPSPTLSRFGSINKTVISILPLVTVIGFMASAGLSGLTGSGQIGGIIRGEVGALIFVLIAISLGPVIFDTLGDASEVVDGDTLSVTKEFGSIQTLILGLRPGHLHPGHHRPRGIQGLWGLQHPARQGRDDVETGGDLLDDNTPYFSPSSLTLRTQHPGGFLYAHTLSEMSIFPMSAAPRLPFSGGFLAFLQRLCGVLSSSWAVL